MDITNSLDEPANHTQGNTSISRNYLPVELSLVCNMAFTLSTRSMLDAAVAAAIKAR